MVQKIKLDDKEYEVETLSDEVRAKLNLIQFATKREQELTNMQALLQRAKSVIYIESLKQEMLSKKAGFLFDED